MREQLHILFLSSWYPNRNQPIHGIFNRYFALAAARYNKVSVLNIVSEADPNATMQAELIEEGQLLMATVYYRKVSHNWFLFSHWLRKKRVLAAADEGMALIQTKRATIDLMQLNVVMPMGVAALHISEKYNLPFVVNENWSGYTAEDGNYKGFIQKYFTEMVIAKAKKIMPTSSYLQKAMEQQNLKGDYRVVPNPVNTEVFSPSPNSETKKNQFIHISSLNDREKNVSGLIRAFHKATLTEEMNLVIVGEGIDLPEYKKLVIELGLQHKIKFAGRLLSQDLAKEINQSEALIMFSNYETFCLVIIEAFASGKPVITSAAGAIPTYMKPELGLMVPIADEKALTESILEFIHTKNKFNATQIRNFAVDHFSYEKVGSDLNEIYNEVLNKS